MQIDFVGTGDAFGSGGRFNTCFHIRGATTTFLIDCGATSLVAMKARGMDRNAIDLILVTHFHGDHFGGIPFFILDAQFFAKRTRPLTIAGPPGLKEQFTAAMETAFAGSSKTKQKFDLTLTEISPRVPTTICGVNVAAAPVVHGPPQINFYGYRISVDGKTIAYTGDTQWTDSLIEIGRGADLLIAEAYYFDKRVPFHLSYAEIMEKLPAITPGRLILTHMNDDMLGRLAGITCEAAYDGLTLTI
jgi:ribonuclease BN (tRNA processing enzyme)